MRSNRLERLARWSTGALLLLLILGFIAPRSARAGCNHLVTSQSDRLLGYDRLDDLITGGSSAILTDGADRERPDQQGPRRPAPCSGPGCSSSVPWPAPMPPPSPVDQDQWAAPCAIPGAAVAPPTRLVPDEPAAQPAGHQPSIFHPPPA
jgi:hypothetical protein